MITQHLGTLNALLSQFSLKEKFLNVWIQYRIALSSLKQFVSSGIHTVNSASPSGKPLEALLTALESVDHLNINSFGY